MVLRTVLKLIGIGSGTVLLAPQEVGAPDRVWRVGQVRVRRSRLAEAR